MMDLIDSVDWMKTEDFRYFVQIVYPFLDSDEVEQFVHEFVAFGENKISKNLVNDFIIDSIIKNKEPRFLNAEFNLNLDKNSDLSIEEYKEELIKISPLINPSLVEKLLKESQMALNGDEKFNIKTLSAIAAYIVFEKAFTVIKESVNNKIDNFRKNANPVCSKLESAVNIIDEKMKLLTISKIVRLAELRKKNQIDLKCDK